MSPKPDMSKDVKALMKACRKAVKPMTRSERLDRIAHASECQACREWSWASMWEEMMPYPRPMMDRAWSKHKDHLQAMGYRHSPTAPLPLFTVTPFGTANEFKARNT